MSWEDCGRQAYQIDLARTLTSQLAALQTALMQGQSMKSVAALLSRMDGIRQEAVSIVTRRSPHNPIWSLFRMPRPTRISGPVQEVDRLNAARRAAFLMQVLRRVSRSGPSLAAMRQRLAREATYARAHIEASNKRELAARAVQGAVDKHGELLGWYATNDERTTAECREADGRNFTASQMPPIGYPGAVHPHCRCTAGPPFRTSARVSAVKPDPFRWADR